MNILVAEDDVVSAQILAHIITNAGHRVKVANDSQHALRLFEKEHFNAVLTDWHMMGMNGVTLIRESKNK